MGGQRRVVRGRFGGGWGASMAAWQGSPGVRALKNPRARNLRGEADVVARVAGNEYLLH